MKPVRVLLADDHELVRAGLRALLRELDIQVVAEASDAHQALRLLAPHKPDVVLMDIAMPGLNGLEATALAVKEFPDVRVIILSMHANVEYARRALAAGAVGYLLKNSKATELDLAIKAVVRGQVYLSPAVAKFIAGDYARRKKGARGAPERLTPREVQVLQLMAKGYTRKQIAAKLNISPKTFDTYRAQIMQQLDAHDVAGLVRYATEKGLVTPSE
ncbi:MAG: response regulator transcription factor [Chloroflexi bacterium]|nr:response regulator transcription factor [Chloroflexota bacterium]